MRNVRSNRSKGKDYEVYCPECARKKTQKVLQSVDVTGREDYEHDFSIDWESLYQIIECPGCSTVSFRSQTCNSEDWDQHTGEPTVTELVYPYRAPDMLHPKDFRGLPHILARIYVEAIKSFNNRLYALCAGGLRALIEGVCFDQNIKKGPVTVQVTDGTPETKQRNTLEGKISGLHEKGVLTRRSAEALHSIRFLGNDALHDLSLPTKDELVTEVKIVEHIFENIYELPRRDAELQQSRKMRKKTKVVEEDDILA